MADHIYYITRNKVPVYPKEKPGIQYPGDSWRFCIRPEISFHQKQGSYGTAAKATA
jgi:hypothetical protein